MNVLFLTLLDFESIKERSIYTDLLREFLKDGHTVYTISPIERRRKQKTHVIEETNAYILKLRIGNTQKTNIIEKGISTIAIESQFIAAIKKFFVDVKFDLVLYSTPPITLQKAVEYVKKRDDAITYLMLKDIFPQNAVDLGMLSKSGLKGVLYKCFRNKEKKLYRISDYIGCMSQANVDYVLKHNPEIEKSKVEICPNGIEIIDVDITEAEKEQMREKYGLPKDKFVFVYGGNLGKPQGIDFMIDCLRSQKENREVFFLIVGSGTEYGKFESFMKNEKPSNVKLIKQMSKDEYDRMIASCDVGMIFLDYRFTIPNFPSRLLSYMQARLPVIAVTDVNTDVGKEIVDGGFGWWCESNDSVRFGYELKKAVECSKLVKQRMMRKEASHLIERFSSSVVYEIIVMHLR